MWVDGDYLLWWFKGAPVPVPLVTTGSAADAVPGALGQKGTRVLFGGQSIDSDFVHTGYRLAVGGWFDDDRTVGLEGSGFYFQPEQRSNFALASDPKTAFPIIGVPFINATPDGPKPNAGGFKFNTAGPATESAVLASNGVGRYGGVTVSSFSHLWGLEANGVINLMCNDTFRVRALVGLRYIDLKEDLDLNFFTLDVADANDIFRTVTIGDHFDTRNQFYGAQVGVRGEWESEWVFASVQGKIALGETHEVVSINGQFADSFPDLYNNFGNTNPFTRSSGIFAQPSNSGRYSRDHFAVLGDIELRAGVNITTNLRAFVGYEFLGLSNVVRPGDQIDRTINTTQVGAGPTGTVPTLTGPARPVPLFQTTEFWAQGVSFGFELRF
jgi:hypothetical protein